MGKGATLGELLARAGVPVRDGAVADPAREVAGSTSARAGMPPKEATSPETPPASPAAAGSTRPMAAGASVQAGPSRLATPWDMLNTCGAKAATAPAATASRASPATTIVRIRVPFAVCLIGSLNRRLGGALYE